MGIPTNCKRLSETAFPLTKVNHYTSIENDKKSGTIGSIMRWWARRPLGSSRAMNLACALPDPSDSECTTEHRRAIANILDQFEYNPNSLKGYEEQDSIGDLSQSRNRPTALTRRLAGFIGDYSAWENMKSERYNRTASELISAVNPESVILVDPFSGGGSIPIEAARMGMDVISTDLNPIPILMSELLLKHTKDELDNAIEIAFDEASRINSELLDELKDILPENPNPDMYGEPMAFLAARTITCEGVTCGNQFPLMTNRYIIQDGKHQIIAEFKLTDEGQISVDLVPTEGTPKKDTGTVKNGDAICPYCGHMTKNDSVVRQLKMKAGGASEPMLIAVVHKTRSGPGKIYRKPNLSEIRATKTARLLANKMGEMDSPTGLKMCPTGELPPQGSLGFRVQRYGMTRWCDIYTPRQLCFYYSLINKVSKIEDKLVRRILAINVAKCTDRNSTLSGWMPKQGKFRDAFSMSNVKMTWDFAIVNLFNTSGGPNWIQRLRSIRQGCANVALQEIQGECTIMPADATHHPLPDNSIDIYATDPPYTDKVPYANLSGYFISWLARMMELRGADGDRIDNKNEVIKDTGAATTTGEVKDDDWYYRMIEKAFVEGRRLVKDDGIGYIVFADKSTKGWTAALSGIVNSGWVVTASWPITAEMPSRLRANQRAALKTCPHIVIRPRLENSSVGEWAEIVNTLPGITHSWLSRMDKEGIIGADAIYSCVGPAIEIFSKYHTVERADGSTVSIYQFLDFLWEVIATGALKILDPKLSKYSLEDDARLSVMILWTLRQSNIIDEELKTSYDTKDVISEKSKSKSADIPFDTASLLSRGIGAEIDTLLEQKVVSMKKKGSEKILSLLTPDKRRHYLLGITNEGSKVQQKALGDMQMKLGESSEDTRARVEVEIRHQGVIEMPKRDSQLDKLHQAMLLHADGNSVALEAHLRNKIGDNPAVWQLAQALNTLYPEGSWERGKIEGVIARHQSLR
jgi:putative DNA methylase